MIVHIRIASTQYPPYPSSDRIHRDTLFRQKIDQLIMTFSKINQLKKNKIKEWLERSLLDRLHTSDRESPCVSISNLDSHVW